MIIYKLIYITFILNYSTKVSGEIYFYWDEVVIHSQKDISNFYINLEALTANLYTQITVSLLLKLVGIAETIRNLLVLQNIQRNYGD